MSGPQEDALVSAQAQNVDSSDVARGAGLAAVARLGALIEVIAQPAYTWMFGLTGYGVYVVLWAIVNILANILDLALGQALQRIVPSTTDEAEQHGVVRFALLLGTGLGIVRRRRHLPFRSLACRIGCRCAPRQRNAATRNCAVCMEPAFMDFR